MGITFPILVTVNLTVKESVKENVPVDSDLQIPNLLLLLTLRCTARMIGLYVYLECTLSDSRMTQESHIGCMEWCWNLKIILSLYGL